MNEVKPPPTKLELIAHSQNATLWLMLGALLFLIGGDARFFGALSFLIGVGGKVAVVGSALQRYLAERHVP